MVVPQVKIVFSPAIDMDFESKTWAVIRKNIKEKLGSRIYHDYVAMIRNWRHTRSLYNPAQWLVRSWVYSRY